MICDASLTHDDADVDEILVSATKTSVSISCHTHVLSKIALELEISYVHSPHNRAAHSHTGHVICAKSKFPECVSTGHTTTAWTRFHGMLIEHDTETLKRIQIIFYHSPLAFLKF